MDLDDAMKPRKLAGPVLGENLAPLSIADLEARLLLIDGERARVEAEIGARIASRDAAETFFKR